MEEAEACFFITSFPVILFPTFCNSLINMSIIYSIACS